MNGGRCRTGYIVGKVVLESGSDCPAGNSFWKADKGGSWCSLATKCNVNLEVL
jgi:hypothetical protein